MSIRIRTFGFAICASACRLCLIDRHGSALDAVGALGVRDEVLALDEDLAVGAQGDRAFAAFDGEILLGFEDQFFRHFGGGSRSGARSNPAQDEAAWLDPPDYYGVSGRQSQRRPFRSPQNRAVPVFLASVDRDNAVF